MSSHHGRDPMNTLEKTVGNCRMEWKQGERSARFFEMKRTPLDNRGFTLLELIMVCLILMILAGLAIPLFRGYQDTAREARTKSELRTLEAAITAFYNDRGFFPALLSDVGYGSLLDPWGNNYRYSFPPSRLYAGSPVNTDYDIWSQGADRTTTSASLVDNEDDIIRSFDGSNVGLAKQLFTP